MAAFAMTVMAPKCFQHFCKASSTCERRPLGQHSGERVRHDGRVLRGHGRRIHSKPDWRGSSRRGSGQALPELEIRTGMPRAACASPSRRGFAQEATRVPFSMDPAGAIITLKYSFERPMDPEFMRSRSSGMSVQRIYETLDGKSLEARKFPGLRGQGCASS